MRMTYVAVTRITTAMMRLQCVVPRTELIPVSVAMVTNLGHCGNISVKVSYPPHPPPLCHKIKCVIFPRSHKKIFGHKTSVKVSYPPPPPTPTPLCHKIKMSDVLSPLDHTRKYSVTKHL